jgi:hypothetical protein
MGGVLNAYSRYGAYRRPYRTGALVLSCANDAEVSLTGVGVYTLMKQTLINVAQEGNYHIDWEMRNSDNVSNVATKFYVNGVAVSAAQTRNSNVYGPKEHHYDINLAAGDLLEIWGDPLGDTVWVRNFRIRYDWQIEYFGDGTSRILVTSLPLSDADLLDFTVIL